MFDLAIAGGVARLTLNRPQVRNAIPAAQWSILADTADRAAKGEARLLLIEGTGEAFCAGADISDFAAMRGDPEAAAAFRRAMRDALDRLRRLAVPTVALVEGPCYGAGVALALACDLRLAGPKARFAITPAKFGISYPQQDLSRLVALVGPGQASRLLLTACGIDGAEAARIGLVELYAPDGLAAAAAELAEAVSANSAASLATLKRGIGLAERGVGDDIDQDRAFDALLASEELGERLRALRGAR